MAKKWHLMIDHEELNCAILVPEVVVRCINPLVNQTHREQRRKF